MPLLNKVGRIQQRKKLRIAQANKILPNPIFSKNRTKKMSLAEKKKVKKRYKKIK